MGRTETTIQVAGHRFFVAPASRRRFLDQATERKNAGETPAPQDRAERFGSLPPQGAGYTLAVGRKPKREFRIILPTKECEKLHELGFECRQWLLSLASRSNKM